MGDVVGVAQVLFNLLGQTTRAATPTSNHLFVICSCNLSSFAPRTLSLPSLFAPAPPLTVPAPFELLFLG